MDNRSEIRQFLATRRARLTPQQAGLPVHSSHRRVPGLRREEVALLAGVSVDYYNRLERGAVRGVSDSVLDAVAQALQLDEAEHAHLLDLARSGHTAARAPRRPAPLRIRPGVQRILDAMSDAPAFVRNARLDVLAANRLARALYAPVFDHSSPPANLARFAFLDPRATRFYPDWDDAAHTAVALLRTEAGRDPLDKSLSSLVGELSTRSETFRTLWARHDVRRHGTGHKNFTHPVVGALELTFETLELSADRLTLTAYTAEPATPSSDALSLLASWAATMDQGRHEITETPTAVVEES